MVGLFMEEALLPFEGGGFFNYTLTSSCIRVSPSSQMHTPNLCPCTKSVPVLLTEVVGAEVPRTAFSSIPHAGGQIACTDGTVKGQR